MNLLLFAVSDVAETILYILLALVVLLVMITIHEAGHYTAGKILGFKINEFAIGMGPKLFSRKKAARSFRCACFLWADTAHLRARMKICPTLPMLLTAKSRGKE